jgi:hypothetical protein
MPNFGASFPTPTVLALPDGSTMTFSATGVIFTAPDGTTTNYTPEEWTVIEKGTSKSSDLLAAALKISTSLLV